MSTARLTTLDPAALPLVRIGAFLAPESILSDVLTCPVTAIDSSWPPEPEVLAAAVTNPVAAHCSLGRVGSYGLARVDRSCNRTGSLDLRELACRTAWHLHSRGDVRSARRLAEHLHRQWREQLGPDDQHTLRSADTDVGILVDVGPYSHARQLCEDTLAQARRVFGDNHPRTLKAANNLNAVL